MLKKNKCVANPFYVNYLLEQGDAPCKNRHSIPNPPTEAGCAGVCWKKRITWDYENLEPDSICRNHPACITKQGNTCFDLMQNVDSNCEGAKKFNECLSSSRKEGEMFHCNWLGSDGKPILPADASTSEPITPIPFSPPNASTSEPIIPILPADASTNEPITPTPVYYKCVNSKCQIDTSGGKDYKNDPTCGGKCKKSNNKTIMIIIITLITILLGSIGIYFMFLKRNKIYIY